MKHNMSGPPGPEKQMAQGQHGGRGGGVTHCWGHHAHSRQRCCSAEAWVWTSSPVLLAGSCTPSACWRYSITQVGVGCRRAVITPTLCPPRKPYLRWLAFPFAPCPLPSWNEFRGTRLAHGCLKGILGPPESLHIS